MTGSNDTEAVGRLKHTARAVAFGASSLLTTKLLVRGNGKGCYLPPPGIRLRHHLELVSPHGRTVHCDRIRRQLPALLP
jgi:hypothetical protein